MFTFPPSYSNILHIGTGKTGNLKTPTVSREFHLIYFEGGQSMKWVVAIIKPHRFDSILEALNTLGVEDMTVSESRGYSRLKGESEFYRAAEYSVNFLPKLKVEIAVSDEKVDEVVDTILKTAKTEKAGDGKIFVLDVVKALRVRSGDLGDDIF
jgi:nitrogen regulatory protein PII